MCKCLKTAQSPLQPKGGGGGGGGGEGVIIQGKSPKLKNFNSKKFKKLCYVEHHTNRSVP